MEQWFSLWQEVDISSSITNRKQQLTPIWQAVEKILERREGNQRKKLFAHQKRAWGKVKLMLATWTPEDDSLWKQCLTGALIQVQKIAVEYLPGGDFETAPDDIKDLPADNLAAERDFSGVSHIDTYANHSSTQVVEMKMLWKQNCIDSTPSLSLSEGSLQEVRLRASELPTARKISQLLALEKSTLCKEQQKEAEEKYKRKRTREDQRDKEKEGVALILEKNQLKNLSCDDL